MTVQIEEIEQIELPSKVEDNGKPIEETEQEDEGSTSEPFDPKAIKVTPKILSLDMLIKRLANNEINLSTEYQRFFRWNNGQQSRLIESLLLRLPLPAFFFDGKDDNKWDVIDGLQRLNTIRRFVVLKEENLRLTDLEYLKQLEGKSFDELPRDLQRPIEEATVTAYIIEAGTPDVVKFNLFKRINTGGMTLTPQEIRHALNQGVPANFVKELADHPIFKKVTHNKVPVDGMQDRDFVTRFVSFYLLDYNLYKPDMDTFLFKGMKALERKTPEQLQDLKNAFLISMTTAWKIFETDAFRKRYAADDLPKPINKALFEILSSSLALLSDRNPAGLNRLVERRIEFRERLITLMNDFEFNRSISQATGQRSNVETRHTKIWKTINDTIA